MKQGELNMSFKQYYEAQSQDKKKKPLEVPRTLAEVFSYFAALIYKHYQNILFCQGLFKCLAIIVQKRLIQFQACEINHMVNSVLLALQIQSEKKHSNLISFANELMEKMIEIMNDA